MPKDLRVVDRWSDPVFGEIVLGLEDGKYLLAGYPVSGPNSGTLAPILASRVAELSRELARARQDLAKAADLGSEWLARHPELLEEARES